MLEKKRAGALTNQGHGVEWNLWHGTSEEIIQQIVTKGFNRSFVIHISFSLLTVGKKYGQGVYFAKEAHYSARPGYAVPNPNGNQHTFLCRVLVGLFTLGSKDMVEPPPIDAQKSVVDTYDSTVDDMANPRIFASCFIDHHAYPDYLIVFNTTKL
ncbi:protein mono-ADP-ribosyltransferase PARP15-like [Oscarella lobularis]|uniref:protein mono-ADP-ribosyltransferase PARP15-like n=1 Tax=Oscarella lobularis TaxID=121494 RepID=UPI0033137E77